MRSIVVVAALALCGCHLIYPFHRGEATDAGVGDARATDGAGEGRPADQGSEEETSPDAGSGGRVVWVKTFGAMDAKKIPGSEAIRDVAVDAKRGAVHLVGEFTKTLTSDGCNVNASGKSAQVLILRLSDANGKCQRANAYGGAKEDLGVAVDVAAAGEIFVAGRYQGTLDLGISSQVPFSSITQDSFVARLDAAGNPVASIAQHGSGNEVVTDLKIDGDGLVAVTGWYNGATIWFDSGTNLALPTSANEAGFFARYATTLKKAVYAGRIAGKGHLRSMALTHNGAQEVYIAGYYSGSAVLDGDPLGNTNGGTKESFVAAFETNSNKPHWAYNVGNLGDSTRYDKFFDVTSLPGKQLLAAVGFFRGAQASYGANKVSNSNGLTEEAVVALFDTTKNEVFSKAWKIGGQKNDQALAVAADAAGNIYVTGFFTDAATTTGPTKLTAVGQSQDIFVTSYGFDGEHRWTATFGGTQKDAPTAITVQGKYVYVTGYFSGKATFGSHPTKTASGSSDAFVLKLEAGL